ncbi:acetyl-CoA synthetase-like protein [Gymnopus androsaceus JB14]|uniref:Acetyl-CoA synthetase-like protein n=1 Tax=Gymnopus androsaceus JB14 TaxID=1447944 RepID=A0A6A4H281_9AGAR|nr:acetyl-CoA synthetase-like protein [Gymnopus androsaceus JB14]
MVWKPQRTVEECNRIITAPGALHELETRVIDGSVKRVYKNLWPSLRVFWLSVCELHRDKIYIVYEDERFTYQQMLEKSVQAAVMLRDSYKVGKGDRVGICSRNYIEYLVAFWACHLIGAVTVMVNAWLPIDLLEFCITYTDCKVILLDSERATVIEKSIPKLSKQNAMTGALVFQSHEGKGSLERDDFTILPEDNAAIYFTSGTTGRPKGVLSTQRQYLSNAFNALVGAMRNTLRKGESLDQPVPDEPQKGFLISVPFFHVTGTTSQGLLATLRGLKIVLIRKWSAQEAVRLIKAENVAIAGGVPAMVVELVDLGGFELESLNFGGAPSSVLLGQKVKGVLPNTILSQGYGMTETNSLAVSIVGADLDCFLHVTLGVHAVASQLPLTISLIMDPETLKEVPVGSVGEVWMKGVNLMQEYWKDPEATKRVMTADGWLRSGDLGYVDEEGFLFIKDRLKDIIASKLCLFVGGENIDSISVENAVYAHPAIQEAAAIGVPDARLGELVAVVASLRPGSGKVTEEEVIAVARKSLPKFADSSHGHPTYGTFGTYAVRKDYQNKSAEGGQEGVGAAKGIWS